MTPSHFVIFLKGDLLRISSGLEFILGYFCFANFGVLELSRVDFTEFGLLEFFWNRHIPLFLCIGSAQILRTCFFLRLGSKLPCLFPFYFIFSWIPWLFVLRGPHAVSFLVLFGLFWLVGTWLLLRGTWFWMFVFFWFKSCILMWSQT